MEEVKVCTQLPQDKGQRAYKETVQAEPLEHDFRDITRLEVMEQQDFNTRFQQDFKDKEQFDTYMSSWSGSILGESPTKFGPLEILTETNDGLNCGSSPETVSISLDEVTQNNLPIANLAQQEFKDDDEVVSKTELCKEIEYDNELFVDVDTKIKVKKFDENENVLQTNGKMENSSHVIPAVNLIECVMVHKPEKCDVNGNNPRGSFLKGLFSTDSSDSVPEKGIASYESSNSVDKDCYQGISNSYYTSFENDPGPIRQADPRDESPEKLTVNKGTNDQEIISDQEITETVNGNLTDEEIMEIVTRDIPDQEKTETENGNITDQDMGEIMNGHTIDKDRMETDNRNSIDPEIMENEVDGVTIGNSEREYESLVGSSKGREEPEDFFENRFSDGFHNAMGMAVVDMQNEEFGAPELSWRIGTICCDSIHTDAENHVASHQHEAKRFKCNDCNLKFSQSQLFLNHIHNHHALESSSSPKCLEEGCRLLFPTAFSLKIHQQEYHVQDDMRMRFKCNSCSKRRKEDRGDGKGENRGESTGEVFVTRIGEHALKVHRELWI